MDIFRDLRQHGSQEGNEFSSHAPAGFEVDALTGVEEPELGRAGAKALHEVSDGGEALGPAAARPDIVDGPLVRPVDGAASSMTPPAVADGLTESG